MKIDFTLIQARKYNNWKYQKWKRQLLQFFYREKKANSFNRKLFLCCGIYYIFHLVFLQPSTITMEIDFSFRRKLLENLLFISVLFCFFHPPASSFRTIKKVYKHFNRIRNEQSTLAWNPKEKLNFCMSTLDGKTFLWVARCSYMEQRLTIGFWWV